MAVFSIYPSKDASIYSEYLVMNTGLDEILECTTYVKDDFGQVSRALIQFDPDEISDIISNKVGSAQFQSNLKLFTANIEGLNLDSVIEIYPVSGSWGMGTGKYGDSDQVTNGVSWEYMTASGSNAWTTSSFGAYATASFHPSKSGGGVWFTGSSLGLSIIHSQSFSYVPKGDYDLKVDVTNTINTWNSGALPNNGFILKQQDSDEFVLDENYQTEIKFFSIDTDTIYPPQLEFKWDDYAFSTGSSTKTILNTSHAWISLDNNEGIYYSESIQKFRINSAPKYPTRTFTTSSIYTTNYYLPESTSLYAIKDVDTNMYVVDFDSTYTRISADATSSYFTVYMNGLEPERNYTIVIKAVLDGSTKIFEDEMIFKIKN